MLGKQQAIDQMRQELGASARATHSLLVGGIMRSLADRFQQDGEFWQIVGILHDLDLPRTETDLTKHGLLTTEMLGDTLPPEGLQAIAAHDHRTGVPTRSLLDESPRVADGLAAIATRVPMDALKGIAAQGEGAIESLCQTMAPHHAHIVETVEAFVRAQGLSFRELLDALREAQRHF